MSNTASSNATDTENNAASSIASVPPAPPRPAKKRLLSGMQPTGSGRLHLGNYEGALKAWVGLQDEYEMFCFVADWHALTTLVATDQSIVADAREIALDYLSAGLDPAKCAIFLQSQVPQHAELFLLLGMLTPVSWVERVPTYKERREIMAEREGGEAGVSYGLLGYPILQAADILVYRAHAVPVGRDQAAHLELSREIARRFNHVYHTDLFPEPQAIISEATGTLIGLDGRKMSKSYNNAIFLTDTADDVAKKIKGAFTTPTRLRLADPGVPEGCSVCQLRRLYDPAGYQNQWDECRAATRGCVQSKKETTEFVNAALEPLRERRALYAGDPAQLDRILAEGAARAREAAEETLRSVRSLMRLV